jgi:alanyl-tRNA synthetase
VLSCAPAGDRFGVLLDRTAFYPASGGQPNDTGRLGHAAVLDVVDQEDHSILHVTDAALSPGPVHGAIDWDRRFDHMQQHTGQHLLSAAFIALFQFPTVSFHLGRDASTIDLAAPSVSAGQVEDAERLTNQIIFEDRPVRVRFGTAEEFARAGVRKEVAREGTLRAIDVEDFDLQPCGGTHVARTGQVGLILLRKVEKQKQSWRVEFVCGYRALRTARGDFAALGDAAGLLTCGLPDVPALLGKTLEERKQAQRSRQLLLEQLASFEAREMLLSRRTAMPDLPIVITRVWDDADVAYLRLLASRLVAEPNCQVFLATRAGGHVIFAQSLGLPADMNALLREVLAAAGGKGGGSHDFAQGSVPDSRMLDHLLQRTLQGLRR